jgi:cytochrome c oxidase subunit 1
MTMFRMPIFTWNIFVTAILILILIAFPVLISALFGLEADFGAHVFDPANGGRSSGNTVLVLRPS